MSLLEVGLLAVYVIGTLWGTRWFTRRQLEGFDGVEDVGFFAVIGLIVASFGWPLLLAFALLEHMAGGDPERLARLIAGESRRAKLARLEVEAMEREQHVAQLERELGIGDERRAV